jgi:tetratricopeptide (TPR) repeat protein
MAIDVSKQIAKAESAFQSRKYDIAIEIFQQALEIDPDNRRGRRGIRMAALKKTEHSYPSGFSIKIATAPTRAGMVNPNPDKKASAYESYLKVDPKSAGMAHKLGQVLEKAGYVSGAIGTYEALVATHPKDEDALVNLGRLLGSREPEEALKHLEKALSLNKKNQQAIKLRKDLAAEISITRTGFESARTTHDLLRDKEQAKQLQDADRLQRTVGDSGDYIGKLKAAVAASPGDSKALRKLAIAYVQSSKYDEAEETWGLVLEADPTDFDARVKLGDLRITRCQRALTTAKQEKNVEKVKLLRRKLLDTQIAEFRTRVAEHPTDLGLRHQLGQALLVSGDVDDAIGEFQKAVKDPRKRFEALSFLGECFLRKELFDLAARQLEKALEESPGLNSDQGKRVVYNLGLLHEKQGDVAAARERYLSIYEVDVSYRDVAKKVTELK